jgi:hypothetical protein
MEEEDIRATLTRLMQHRKGPLWEMLCRRRDGGQGRSQRLCDQRKPRWLKDALSKGQLAAPVSELQVQ